MAKNCICCNEEKGIFKGKAYLLDGMICQSCLVDVKIPSGISLRHISSMRMKEICDERLHIAKRFTETTQFGSSMQVDNVNKIFRISEGIFNYSDLESFEFLEDNVVTCSGGVEEAVVGGLVAGPVGAVVCGMIADQTSSANICDSLKLRLWLINTYTDMVDIDFIKRPTPKKSGAYKMILKSAEELSQFLYNVIVYNIEKEQIIRKSSIGTYQYTSLADEIQKIKDLLDDGAITKMEYEVLKKKIIEG